MPSSHVIERFVGPDLTLQIEGVPDAFHAGCFESQFGTKPDQVQGLGDNQGAIHGHQICEKMREIEQSFIHVAQLSIQQRLIL
jgi:hypothetical protein